MATVNDRRATKREALLPTLDADHPTASAAVLVVDDEEGVRRLVSVALRRAGYDVTLAVDGLDALARIAEATPDLIISDVMMPELDGFGLLGRLRADPATREIPVIMLTARGATDDIVTGLDLGADDYLAKPFNMGELLARVRAKTVRPPVPADLLPRDRQTGLLTTSVFRAPLLREVTRAEETGRPGCLALLRLEELPQVRQRLGARAEAAIGKQLAALLLADARPVDVAGTDGEGGFTLLLPEIAPEAAKQRLAALAMRIVAHTFAAGGEQLRLTPVIGWASFAPDISPDMLRDRAARACDAAASHLDLRPVRYDSTKHRARSTRAPGGFRRLALRLRLPLQLALVQLVSLVVPFLLYATQSGVGYDLTRTVYLAVVIALAGTAYFIWVESFMALRIEEPPPLASAAPYPLPPASAIIAAYLPNEAATVMETIEAFLRQDYPGPLQIILAYNTPRDLPVEEHLHAIARRNPRFLPLRVEGSTSKAQNVNAALAKVQGEFIGVFDADHHPAPGSFERAWRWLAGDYDIVQGHCLVRNGDASWVARLVAVEFESIYAVAHPGRTRLHRFGLFGGSNGYWRTDALRRMRMQDAMLTEDIDSSMRALLAGYRVASDPGLISRELAPVRLDALVNQRLRWAQGWFQVALRHTGPALRSPHLTLRQKLGILHLMAWRELYPLISVQMFPILAYWVWTGGRERIDWFVPLFVLTTLFTLGTGPAQVFFAYVLAHPTIRRQRGWFFSYLLIAILFYTGLKNLIAVVGQIKELTHERQWKVTPRTATTTPAEKP